MPQDTVREIFRRNINALLKEKNITQKDLADYMEVSPTTVNNWVKGYKIPRMDKIDKLCSFFGVDRSALIESAPAPAQPPAQKEDREHKHLQNLLSDPHLRRILESSGQLSESSLQEVQNFIDFQLGKKKQ